MKAVKELTPAPAPGDMLAMSMPAPADRPQFIRDVRARLGLTAEAFAHLMGAYGGRLVRKWEAGEVNITDAVIILATLLDQCEGAMDIADRLVRPALAK